MTATRRLAAILAADVAGYSRLIGADEGGTLQALKAIRAELIDPTIAALNGRVAKTTGMGFSGDYWLNWLLLVKKETMRKFIGKTEVAYKVALRADSPRLSEGTSGRSNGSKLTLAEQKALRVTKVDAIVITYDVASLVDPICESEGAAGEGGR
jgi:hypothetical protein